MKEINELVKEFDKAYGELTKAKESNQFHEASDTMSYMIGLTRAMSIILDCNINTYNQEDRRSVDGCVSVIDILYN